MEQTLRANLNHDPCELKFGTSGRRGRLVDLTQLEVYVNASAELEYLQSLPLEEGGIERGDEFYFAYDLRPSSTEFVQQAEGRGELAQAIERAIRDAGMQPVNLGAIPTPALTFYAISRSKGSMMVTGSHIPFDRNGYKTNTSRGELLKRHEEPIGAIVRKIRDRECQRSFATSLFNALGMFKAGHQELPRVDAAARDAYVQRYLDFWPEQPLHGMRVLFYEHSSVGRDLLPAILEGLGARLIRAGRSDAFVPIDTENLEPAQLAVIQTLADQAVAQHGPFDAIVSADGDSDRPLILGMEPSTSRVQFYPGDLAGMIAAAYLHADAVVVPISCNDAIDRSSLKQALEPKTRIGSPFVIAGMEAAAQRGKKAVCGWEANGGFLTGSDFMRNGRTLKALPTRDAMLPIVAVLASAREKGLRLDQLFSTLPKRFTSAALKRNFPQALGARIVSSLSDLAATEDTGQLSKVRERLASVFSAKDGFSEVAAVDLTDGVRVTFQSDEVAHLRPSGNADEFRVYAVADSPERAAAITSACLKEPGGVLWQLQRELT